MIDKSWSTGHRNCIEVMALSEQRSVRNTSEEPHVIVTSRASSSSGAKYKHKGVIMK